MGFLRNTARKINKKKDALYAPYFHFRRFDLFLVGCSPAEPISVLIEQCKFLNNQLYLQTVKKASHLPEDYGFQVMKR
jgi:hypothetical protein